MDEDSEFPSEAPTRARCPDDCPNAMAPYCPAHEDPSIYRRDEMKLHLVEAYAHNAARGMVIQAIESVRGKRKIKEIRVPMRQMDEWIVFTTKVVLDSGEFTAQGEIERKVAQWLEKQQEQDWAALDRLKERYMAFTSDWRGESGGEKPEAQRPEKSAEKKEPKKGTNIRRPKASKSPYPDADAEYFEDDF